MRSAAPPTPIGERSSARPDGTLGALEVWNDELRVGQRTAGQLDALARAAMYDAAARDATRSARACDALAEHADTTADRVRFASCADVDRRAATEYRRRAAAALLTDAASAHASALDAPGRGWAA